MTHINQFQKSELDLLENGLELLQRAARDGSVAKGFGREGDEVREWVAGVKGLVGGATEKGSVSFEFAEARLADYYSKRLFLIVTEPVEAFEEVRSGKRAVDETYYPTLESGGLDFDAEPEEHKPEGVPSELADTVIRCFDLADEIGIDLAAMIVEKLRYNATRPTMHGRKF